MRDSGPSAWVIFYARKTEKISPRSSKKSPKCSRGALEQIGQKLPRSPPSGRQKHVFLHAAS